MSYSQSFPLAPTEETTITIGALIPLTGSLSIMGETARATLQIAEKDFEREFPLAHVELVMEDTASDAATALSKLQSLFQRGIRVFIGPFSSEELLHVKSFADANGCILISPTSTAPSLSLDDNIFRLITNDRFQSYALSYFIHSTGVDHLIPLARNDTYGQDFMTVFPSGFQEFGAVSSPILYDPATVDFQPIIARLVNEIQSVLQEKPDAKVGILAVSFDEIAAIFQAASQSEMLQNLRWFGTDTNAENPIIAQNEITATFAAQVKFTASISNILAWYHPMMSFSAVDQLLYIKVSQLYHFPQEPIVTLIYEAFWLSGIMQFVDSANLKEALLTASKLYGGHIGFLNFNQNGDISSIGYCFYQFQNGGIWPLVGSFDAVDMPDGSLGDIQFSDKPLILAGMYKNVRIGALISLTGNYGEKGQKIHTVLQTAQQNITSILQRVFTPDSSLDLLVEDTASDSETALQKMIQLHEQGIQYFIGPLTSEELENVAAYAEENELIVISPSSTATALSRDDTIFRMTLNDQKQAKSLAALLADQQYTRAAVLYRNDMYGAGFYQDFKTAFELTGGTCDEGISYENDTSDFTQTIRQLEERAQPKNRSTYAIVVVGFDEVIHLLSAIPDGSVLTNLRWFGTDGFALNAALLTNPRALAFALQTHLTASIWGTDFPQLFLFPNHVLLNDITDHVGFDLHAFDIASYESTLIYLTIKEFMDWETSATFAQSLDALRTLTNFYLGLMSPCIMNETGDREYGTFDFYQVGEKENTASWTPYATYLFDYFTGEETLTYRNTQPPSSYPDWELFQ